MSTPIQTNTEELRKVLQMVKNLPVQTDQGTETAAAIEIGTFTPTNDVSSDYTIPHGLGVQPDFFIVVATGEFNLPDNSGYLLWQNIIRKQFSNASNTYYGRGATQYVSSTAAMSGTSTSFNSTAANMGRDYIEVYFGSNNNWKLKAGTTYRWIAGVLGTE